LPDSGRDDELDVLASRQILPKSEDGGAAVREKLEHLDRVAEIEVVDLVGCKDVHFGKGSRLEQIEDRCAHGAIATRHSYGVGGGVAAAEEAALDRQRFQLEQRLDLIGGHCS